MIRVEKREDQCPESLDLSNPNSYASKELQNLIDYFAGRLPDKVKFKAYSNKEVKIKLGEIFHQKCAFCEIKYAGSSTMDVEHYRPKAGIEEKKAHTGYWWLAMEWKNLIPSCSKCNREQYQDVIVNEETKYLKRGKGNFFPLEIEANRVPDPNNGDVYINESPLLLNPTFDTPEDHLDWKFDSDFCLIVPKMLDGRPSQRGLKTIDILGLNRVDLARERTFHLHQLKLQVKIIKTLNQVTKLIADPKINELLQELIIDCMKHLKRAQQPNHSFSGMAKAFVKKFESEFM